MKGTNTNNFKKGYGATPAKHKPVFHNGHIAPLYIVSKDFDGDKVLNELVRPGVYRPVSKFGVELAIANNVIGWDVAKMVMDFAEFVYHRGGFSIDTAKFDKPA